MDVKKFTSFCQALKRCTQKKIGSSWESWCTYKFPANVNFWSQIGSHFLQFFIYYRDVRLCCCVHYGGNHANNVCALYLKQLVDLPCIIESLKTTDRKNFFKTADISQVGNGYDIHLQILNMSFHYLQLFILIII